jgi:hypothetical protein
MAIGCSCDAGLSNTGRPGCVPLQSVTRKLILVPLYANDGTKNRIDLSAPLPTWADLVNEVDASKRWFPLPEFENVELPKADTLFEEAASGRKARIRQGVRSFTGELWEDDSTPTFLGKLEAARCVEFGAYVVDINGSLIGLEENGYLYPLPVDNDSWDPKFMFASDTTVQKIMVAFDFDRLLPEHRMYMITATEAGINFNSLRGLLDVNLVEVSSNATTTVVEASFDYGTALNRIKYQGAGLPADWTLFNNTTALAVTITTVVENPTGTYTISYSAGVTVADSLTLSTNKAGFIGSITYVA